MQLPVCIVRLDHWEGLLAFDCGGFSHVLVVYVKVVSDKTSALTIFEFHILQDIAMNLRWDVLGV